jgi:deferrochelatase/peroxidase EfeB
VRARLGTCAGGGSRADGGGLLFLAYQRDPRRQFVVLQRRLAAHDALSAYARHVGSAVFALPPGARRGGFIADRLVAP